MQKMIPALTEWQPYWLEHIQACEASGKSMAEYAASKDIVGELDARSLTTVLSVSATIE